MIALHQSPNQASGCEQNVAKGFTLIEVLIVLIIVSVITAVAVLAFGHFDRGRREKMVMQQFVRVITVAQQQAILSPMVLGLAITADGYTFYRYQPKTQSTTEKWLPLSDDALSNQNAFRHLFQAQVKSIAAFSAAQRATPSILFLPSGFVTPFVLTLEGTRLHVTLTIQNNGAVREEK